MDDKVPPKVVTKDVDPMKTMGAAAELAVKLRVKGMPAPCPRNRGFVSVGQCIARFHAGVPDCIRDGGCSIVRVVLKNMEAGEGLCQNPACRNRKQKQHLYTNTHLCLDCLAQEVSNARGKMVTQEMLDELIKGNN